MQAYDFIVVGSGIAGLSFALKAAAFGKVLIVTKKLSWSGSTVRAQGGIASVMDPTDSFQRHLQDTLDAGAGLCRMDRVRILVEQGPEAISNLLSWGVNFTKSGSKRPLTIPFDLHREGGHSHHRILHADDITGKEIQRALLEAAHANSNIRILENFFAIDLLTAKHFQRSVGKAPEDECYGVYALDEGANEVKMFVGAHVILCTGGVGQVYSHTTNDTVSTGDGVAMAYRAGAKVEDMEFMQFHPTSFYNPGHPTYLISEALRGEGGILRNQEGDSFMDSIHPMKSLAPRDVVARAIDAEMKRSGKPCVYLDVTFLGRSQLRRRFPNITRHCRGMGLDISRSWIPVVPAAHFMCGGVKVDSHSATSVKGLYAVGETACTGVHGANRLASNSLLEAVVFAERAVRRIVKAPSSRPHPEMFRPWDSFDYKQAPERIVYSHGLEAIRSTMWDYVGILRSDARLGKAREYLRVLRRQISQDYWSFSMEPHLIELRNLILNAELIVKSALRRKESRGLHFNVDYPETRPHARHTILKSR